MEIFGDFSSNSDDNLDDYPMPTSLNESQIFFTTLPPNFSDDQLTELNELEPSVFSSIDEDDVLKKRPFGDSFESGSAPISKATKTSVPTYSLVAKKKIKKHEVFFKEYPVVPYLGDLDPDKSAYTQFLSQLQVMRLAKINQKTTKFFMDPNHFLAVFPQNQTFFKIGNLKLAANLFKKHPTNDDLFFDPALGGVFARISDNIDECNAVARLGQYHYLDFLAIKEIKTNQQIVVFSEIKRVDGFVTNYIDEDDIKKIYFNISKALGTSVEDTPYAQNNFSNYKEDTRGYKENYRAIVFKRIYESGESGLESTQVQIKVESTSKVATADFITTAIGYLFI